MQTRAIDVGTDVMIHAIQMLPEGMDLTNEDEFVQAGAMLVDQISACMIGLGEMLEWKLSRERAFDDEGRDRIFSRYAHAWGTSRTTLMKAWVLASKYPDVERPEDVAHTTAYEVLSGSDTPEEAEAGMQAVVQQGLGTEKVREAKALQRDGHNEKGDWSVPFLFYRDGDIWARASDGGEVRVWKAVNEGDKFADAARALSRRRMRT